MMNGNNKPLTFREKYGKIRSENEKGLANLSFLTGMTGSEIVDAP